jgi:Ku70/Ku80 beta-barrel domain/Ku70/Ku80 C-terminal arm
VVPSVGNSNKDKIALHSIVQEMIKMNKVLICRFVPRANADPRLVVLNPHVTFNGAVFYLNNLPTVEDLRDFQFESLNECTVKQEEVVSKFIDTLDLDEQEDEEKEERLKPNNVYNPTLQYFYQCLEHRVLNDENNLPKLDETIEDYMRPDKSLFENNKYVSFLPKVFDIKQSKEIFIYIIRGSRRKEKESILERNHQE